MVIANNRSHLLSLIFQPFHLRDRALVRVDSKADLVARFYGFEERCWTDFVSHGRRIHEVSS